MTDQVLKVNFNTLPIEIHFLIFEHLSALPLSLVYLSACNKSIRERVKSWNPWQRLNKKYFKNWDIVSGLSESEILETTLLELAKDPTAVNNSPRGPSHTLSVSYEKNMRFFLKKWSSLRRVSRGACYIRGSEIIFGNTSSTQMSEHCVFGAFGTNCITCWEISSGDGITKFEGHVGTVVAVQIDDTYLVSSGVDRTIRIWSRPTGRQLHRVLMNSVVRTIRFNAFEIICGDSVGNIYVIETFSGKLLKKIPMDCHFSDITHIHFDERFICSTSSDRVFQVYDRLNKKKRFYFNMFSSLVTTFTMTNNIAALGTWEGTFYIFRLDGATTNTQFPDTDKTLLFQVGLGAKISILGPIEGHSERINCIQFFPLNICRYFNANEDKSSYQAFVSCSNDSTMCIWAPRINSNTVHYECLFKLQCESPVLCVEIAPKPELDLVILSAACLDGKLNHWHLSLNRNSQIASHPPNLIKMYSNDHFCSPVKVGTQTTFGSSFLPFMVYQEFIQLLLDRNPEEMRTAQWQANVIQTVNDTNAGIRDLLDEQDEVNLEEQDEEITEENIEEFLDNLNLRH